MREKYKEKNIKLIYLILTHSQLCKAKKITPNGQLTHKLYDFPRRKSYVIRIALQARRKLMQVDYKRSIFINIHHKHVCVIYILWIFWNEYNGKVLCQVMDIMWHLS